MTLSEKKKISNANWDRDNIERLSLVLRKPLKSKIKERAADLGKPVNRYIVDLIKDDLGEF